MVAHRTTIRAPMVRHRTASGPRGVIWAYPVAEKPSTVTSYSPTPSGRTEIGAPDLSPDAVSTVATRDLGSVNSTVNCVSAGSPLCVRSSG
ncbi:MAG TPA: hypothetical protein VM677_27385 [Actinokineospora sp.]|nr:hypothetical protein [Actinokineospora sp.]